MQRQQPAVALVIAAVVALIFLCHLMSPPPRGYARHYQGINRCWSAQSFVLTNFTLTNGASYPY